MRSARRWSVMLICFVHVAHYSPLHHVGALEVPSTGTRTLFRHQVLMMAQNSRLTSDDIPSRPITTHHSARGGGEKDAYLTNLSYYLVWSPTFLPKTFASFFLLLFARPFLAHRVALPAAPFVTAHRRGMMSILATSMEMILLPLLSSACCSIQLLINVMVGAGGCAGFNKHLGPLRPYFLGILLSVVVPMIVTRNVMSWPKLVVQLFLAFLPELVHVWNSNPFHLAFGRLRSSTKEKTDSTLVHAQAEMVIPGMGCVACINKINNSLQQCEIVTGSEAWLEGSGGKASVVYVVDSEAKAEDVAIQLANVVREAGFDQCLIGTVRTINTR
ncbi:hypothetical protein MHU86_9684 [Fragilaria crotonensis]|nr:hypothetical protein MHU86_9684 [Fragilaria crotonensis]